MTRQFTTSLTSPLLALLLGLGLSARFEVAKGWRLETTLGFIVVWFLSCYATSKDLRRCFTRWHLNPKYVLSVAIACFGWIWIAHMPDHFDYRLMAIAGSAGALGSLAQFAFFRQARRTRSSVGESIRWLGLAAICAWVIHPYATPHLVGGGDAHHYAQQLADAAQQLRQGDYQLYVGQSSFAFNGDIHPLRTAPYFSYLGAVVSIVVGPDFAATAVQNLIIVLSLALGVGLLYALLTRLRPQTPWLAFWLAAAFASSPGILSLVYSGDMVASWLTLPWLPLIFYAVIRLWIAEDPVPPLLVLAAALAIVWLAHPPIAFWTSALIVLPLAARIVLRWEQGRSLWLLSACGLGCLLLGGYVFVSVKTLDLPTDPKFITLMRTGGMLDTLKMGWSGLARPMEASGSNLIHNLQLSPALWLAVLVGLGVIRTHRWSAGLLLFGAIGMLVLLYPSTNVAVKLWAAMPESVLNATDQWPMQRFYPILSALVPFIGLLAWPAIANSRRRWITHGLLVALALGVAFSLYDTRKLVARGKAVTSSADMSQRRLRPENALFSRYSYGYYGMLPRPFTNGTVSPWMQNRLLSRGTLTPIDTNLLALENQGSAPIRSRHRFIATDYGGRYEPPLRLEPSRTYFVRFLFGPQPAHGTLQLLGRYIYREYPLPISGEAHAFGMIGPRRNGFSLWTTAPVADDVDIRFYNQPDTPAPRDLGAVELVSVDQNRLPLRLLSVHPYQIVVKSSVPTWLETPKLFIAGYSAEIDGKPAPVERSPDGLVMIPVPAGQHRVHLNYVGPIALRTSYWATIAAWLGLLAYWHWYRNRPQAARAAFVQFGRLAAGLVGIATISVGVASTYPALRGPDQIPPIIVSPTEVQFTLPVGRAQTWEQLWSFEHAGATWTVKCFYENGQSMRLGLAQGSHLFAVSEAFQINYLRTHRLIAQLTEPSTKAAPKLQLWVNQRLVLRPDLKPSAPTLTTPSSAPVIAQAFSGRVIHIGPCDGPIE